MCREINFPQICQPTAPRTRRAVRAGTSIFRHLADALFDNRGTWIAETETGPDAPRGRSPGFEQQQAPTPPQFCVRSLFGLAASDQERRCALLVPSRPRAPPCRNARRHGGHPSAASPAAPTVVGTAAAQVAPLPARSPRSSTAPTRRCQAGCVCAASSANGWKDSTAPGSSTTATTCTASPVSAERDRHADAPAVVSGAGAGCARRQEDRRPAGRRSRPRSTCGWRLPTSATRRARRRRASAGRSWSSASSAWSDTSAG